MKGHLSSIYQKKNKHVAQTEMKPDELVMTGPAGNITAVIAHRGVPQRGGVGRTVRRRRHAVRVLCVTRIDGSLSVQ